MALSKTTSLVTIANGASLSTPASLGAQVLCGILVPAGWTAAALTFQASDDGGATWQSMFDATGAEIAISSAAVAAGQRISINSSAFVGVDLVRVRSGTTAAPVSQGAARTLTLVSRKSYGNS